MRTMANVSGIESVAIELEQLEFPIFVIFIQGVVTVASNQEAGT